MIILGDDLIPYEDTIFINCIKDIKNSKANSTIVFEYDKELLKYSSINDLPFAVVINSIKESIYCNALGASYIITQKELAQTLQEIAENYMFDSKILMTIEQDSQIEEVALLKIDGAIYKKLLN